MSLSFCPSAVLPGIAQQNYTIKKKIDSYIPPTTNPPKSPITSSSAFSSGLFRGLGTNDQTNPDPATTAFPEDRRVRFQNCIRSDTGRVGEEAPEGVGSRFGPDGGEKIRSAPSGHYDPDLTFSSVYRSIVPIWMTSVFLVKSFFWIW